MAGKFQMKGGDRLLRLLRAAPKAASDEVRAVVKKEAEALAEDIRGAAPEDTGALKAAIRARVSQRGLVARVGIFGIRKELLAGTAAGLRAARNISKRLAMRVASQLAGAPFYARFVEFGTQKTKAQPYLYPTFRQKRRAIRGAIVQAAVGAIRRAAR